MNLPGRKSLFILVLLTACGGGSNDPAAPVDPNEMPLPAMVDPMNTGDPMNPQVVNGSGSTWTLDETTFEANPAASFQEMVNGIDGQVNVVGTVISEVVNADGYTGSQLQVRLIDNGSGVYQLVNSSNALNALQSNSPGTSAAYSTLSAFGEEPGSVAIWHSVTGTLTVSLDSEGFYHISTTEPIVFDGDVDVSNGVLEVPAQVSVSINNLFGFQMF